MVLGTPYLHTKYPWVMKKILYFGVMGMEARSKTEQKTVKGLVRSAVETEFFAEESCATRQHALHDLLSLDAPVSDWNDMEAEIERGVISVLGKIDV